MGDFTEHLGRRAFAAMGGALVSAFGPSVVPDRYEPWLVGLGLLVIVGAIVWPYLELWPGHFLKEHVVWRFRLRRPATAAGVLEAERPPTQVIEMPFFTDNGETIPAPLKEDEQGPCRQALLVINKFLVDKVGPFHAELAAARNSTELKDLRPHVHVFRRRAEALSNDAALLQAQHKVCLKRMAGPDLTELSKKLSNLKTKLIGVKEGSNWEMAALMDRVRPMHQLNLEVGRITKEQMLIIDKKLAELFP